MLAYFLISGFLVLGSVLSMLGGHRWWAKAFEAARFHLLVGMLGAAVCGFAFLDFFRPTVLSMQALLLLGSWCHFRVVFPFTPFANTEVEPCPEPPRQRIRFFTANVRQCNHSYARLLSLLEKHQPDVVLLTEPDQAWLDAVKSLCHTYPHTLLQPQDNTYGMALYSRLPLAKSTVKFLVEKDIPSMHVELWLEGGQRIQYIGLHPRPPAPWNAPKHRVLELLEAARTTNSNELPTVVSGDLNDVGWSPLTQKFKELSGLSDPRLGRGFFNTYNALVPFCRVPIDHFFVSKDFGLVRMERLEKFGSDHFPVLLEVGIDC